MAGESAGAEAGSPLHILLVEDDSRIAADTKGYLDAVGWRVSHAACLADAHAALSAETFDCVVLDRGLPATPGAAPDGDGLSLIPIADRLPRRPYILVLSAVGDAASRIHGLQSGADDYMVKPFEPLELVARLRALVRRGRPAHDTLELHGVRLDLRDRIARYQDRRIDLSPTAFGVLVYLGERRPEIATRAMLLRDVWNMRFDPGTNVVEVAINRLRKTLRDAEAPDLIETVKGEPSKQKPGGWRIPL
ncbi:MAG: response regulator [Alphaproteobacteria bacterium]|nr:response regulator [Alphaproteobacteria bacterium]